MTEQRIEEDIAIKISETLNEICPSFEKHDEGAVEWHNCSCKVSNIPCTCVWHLTDTCVAGTWEKLSFVRRYQEKKVTQQNIELSKAVQAASNSNTKNSINDRFDILDL